MNIIFGIITKSRPLITINVRLIMFNLQPNWNDNIKDGHVSKIQSIDGHLLIKEVRERLKDIMVKEFVRENSSLYSDNVIKVQKKGGNILFSVTPGLCNKTIEGTYVVPCEETSSAVMAFDISPNFILVAVATSK